MSYQYHHVRNEFFIIVSGVAKVTLNDEEIILEKNQVLSVPVGLNIG